MKATITTEPRLQQVIGEIRKAWKAGHYLRVQWSDEKPRSLPQNALMHEWFEQIARELGEGTPEDVKCECKLRYGVPILRAEDQGFRDAYDATIKRMDYERKLKAMRFWPVTSLMNVSQLSRMLEDMQRAYAMRVQLQFPDEWRNVA